MTLSLYLTQWSEKGSSVNYKCVHILPRDPAQIRRHTRTLAGWCVSEVVLVAISEWDFLMWLNAGRGWNLRCGVLFLSETILIMLPYMLPTKHPGNKQGKRSESPSLWCIHTHPHMKLCYYHCSPINLVPSDKHHQYLSYVHPSRTHIILCTNLCWNVMW